MTYLHVVKRQLWDKQLRMFTGILPHTMETNGSIGFRWHVSSHNTYLHVDNRQTRFINSLRRGEEPRSCMSCGILACTWCCHSNIPFPMFYTRLEQLSLQKGSIIMLKRNSARPHIEGFYFQSLPVPDTFPPWGCSRDLVLCNHLVSFFEFCEQMLGGQSSILPILKPCLCNGRHKSGG